MKEVFIVFGFMISTISLFGQAEQSTYPIAKAEGREKLAAKIELPYSPQVVKEALNDITNPQVSSAKASSYRVLQSTKLMTNNKELSNVHFYVQQKHSSDPNVTELYLNLLSPGKDLLDIKEEHLFTMSDAIDFLNGFEKVIKPFAQARQLHFQSTELMNCKAKMLLLEEEAVNLEKEQRALKVKCEEESSVDKRQACEKKLETCNNKRELNRNACRMQASRLDKENKALDALKEKIK